MYKKLIFYLFFTIFLSNLQFYRQVSAKTIGPFDKYDKVFRLIIDISGRKFKVGYKKNSRIFKIKLTGKYDPDIFITKLPEYMGKIIVENEVGPLTSIEINFPNAYTEAKFTSNESKLIVTVGMLRKEFYLKKLAKEFLSETYNVPEQKIMKVYNDVENLIVLGKYEQARKILLKLPLGHGNGLRGLRLGDIELYKGKLATALRNYDGVVRRYGNVFFAIMARFHLFVVKSVLYNKKPKINNLENILNTVKPLGVQYTSRIQTASGLYKINMFKGALSLLIPVPGKIAKSLKQKIVRDYIRWHYSKNHYTNVILMYEHNIALIAHSPFVTELHYKVATSMFKVGYYKKTILLLQKELKKHGKWLKYQIFPEKAFALLARSYFHSNNIFKAKAAVRFYLENKPNLAPNAAKIWELFGKIMLKEKRFEIAHKSFLFALKNNWDKISAIHKALEYSHIAYKQKNYFFLKDYFNFVINPDYEIPNVKNIFIMLYKIASIQENLDDFVKYCKRLPHISSEMAVLCANANAKLGDIAEEFIMLEYASMGNNTWSFIAKERQKYILNSPAQPIKNKK